MKVGDLVRIKSPAADNNFSLLHITEVAKTGISVIVVSGYHLGSEFFLPFGNREIILVASKEKE